MNKVLGVLVLLPAILFTVTGLRWLVDKYTRFSQFLVFREDWPIVASQTPANVDDVRDEKLLPSDAPVLAFRKLRRSHLRTGTPTAP